MNVPALETAGLAVGYGACPVVSGVSVAIAPGTLWAVLGPNGSGKSTLLRTVLGLLRPLAGEVSLFGTPLVRWERRALARRVAWVPQAFDGDAGFTGLELVLMGRAPHQGGWGLPGPKDLAVARAALAELGIAHLAGRVVSRLSGGERRLLLVARALAQEPALLLLDEPTAFLDLQHQAQVLERVRSRVRGGLAAVAVLHDPNLAAAFADQGLLLRDGQVLGQGASAELLDAGRLGQLYGLGLAEARTETGHRLFAPRGTP
ncbi:MAG TPA: ABC transporter ATP-binding protein [Myxococcaceae bacterium]|nr:ABC transporter ATP-binding protein [Myxococcaceae bacterium]